MSYNDYQDQDFENLDEMWYSLVTEPQGNKLRYTDMMERVQSPKVREQLLEEKCDTPIKYHFNGRYGFISVQEFLVRGELIHCTMIINKNVEESYMIHPDLAEKALGVEQTQARQSGGNPKKVRREEVLIPSIQVNINSKEYYVW